MNACASCNEPVQAHFRFCPSCGATLNEGTRATSATIPATIERKIVSVLFADLCSSTDDVAGLDPEDAKEYLERVLAVMTHSVHAYGGTVSQLLGDGLIALFGAPLAQEDHAMRACLAAIAIQVSTRGGLVAGRALRIRIGIHSGEVVVGPANDDLASFYRADGSTIHIASRIEQMAAAGTVLITGSTFRLVSDQLEAQSTGLHEIRGLDRELEVFELATLGQRSAAGPMARRQRLTRLTGRDDVLRAVATLTSRLSITGLRVAAFCGDAGIGKSRLLAEVGVLAALQGLETCHVAARAWSGHISYGFISTLIAELMALPAEPGNNTRSTTAREQLASWPEAAARQRAVVNDLLDIDPPTAAWQALTPMQRRRDIAVTVQWLVKRRQGASPLLLVLDDLHTADLESARLLEALIPKLQASPVLVCLGYRPDFKHQWADAPWLSRFDLAPLGAPEMRSLAHQLLGTDSSLNELITTLVARADGNPLYLEQIALSLIDDGSLLGTPGAYRSVRESLSLRIPDTIAAIVMARVDRLPAAAKALVEATAVLAEPVDADLIATMLQTEIEEGVRLLTLAGAAGLLSPALRNERQTWQFTHGLMLEAVLASLTSRRRRQLHRAACDALQAGAYQVIGERSAVLAHHAWHGEAWEIAAQSALAAITRSVARSANRDAVRMVTLGLDAVGRMTASPTQRRCELALRLEAITAQLPMGQIDTSVDNLERAEIIAASLGDTRQQANASLQLAVLHWVSGNYPAGIAAATRASNSVSPEGDRSIEMASIQLTMMMNHGMGNYPNVVAEALRLETEFRVELETRQFIPGWATMADVNRQCFLADALWRMGEYAKAQEACDGALRNLARYDHAFSRSLVHFTQAECLLATGHVDEAITLLASTVELCRKHDLAGMMPAVVAALAGATALGGDGIAALAMLDKALENGIDQAGGRYNAFYYPKNRAITLGMFGRFEEAIAAAAQARGAAADFDQTGHEAEGLALQAELERLAGYDERSRAHTVEAQLLAASCGARVVVRGIKPPLQGSSGNDVDAPFDVPTSGSVVR